MQATSFARRVAVAALFYLAAAAAHAGLITYDFEAFADGTPLTGQYPGLHIANGTVLHAGVSLNETAFPPHSGTGVLFDDGGPIVITFDTLVQSVAGYFTYAEGLTFAAYDGAGDLLGTATGAWLNNLADGGGDPGSAPNELLGFDAGSDRIARLIISGAGAGSSLVLDDLVVGTGAVAVPEPATLPLVALGLAALLARRRPRR